MARHYTRLDTTVCPDRDECARTFHLQLFEGDCCECCGAMIEDNEGSTVATKAKTTNRAPKEAIRRLRIIQARLEALSDTTTPDGPSQPGYTFGNGHGTSSPESAERLGRPYSTNIPLEVRREVAPYVQTWMLAELEQILPWLEGGERPVWYDLNP